MLLTTSHLPATSGGRIPPALFDLYVQYKKDTRAIVAWLMSHGTSKFKRLHAVSIRDLLGLAEVVQKKAVVMPDTIDFQFREAIAARTQLSNFFRTKSGPALTFEDTVNHEFFTERWARTPRCCCTADKRRIESQPVQNLYRALRMLRQARRGLQAIGRPPKPSGLE